MQRRLLGALVVAVMMLLTAGATTPGADAVPPLGPVSAESAYSRPAPGVARSCYAQLDHDAFGSIVSQNFEPTNDIYDAQAADDFVLTKPCRHPVLHVEGTYGEGVGPADSFNVTLYRAGKHGPGKVARYLDGVDYVDTCHELGCVSIELGKKLRAGHWWVSAQANLSYSDTGTEWSYWTNLTVRNTAARWQNPADGFGTGCTTYTDLITCVGEDTGMGGDLSFSVSSS